MDFCDFNRKVYYQSISHLIESSSRFYRSKNIRFGTFEKYQDVFPDLPPR